MRLAPRIARPGLALAAALLFAGNANATLIPGFTLQDFPDIVSGFIATTYDADSDVLMLNGTAIEIDIDGSPPSDILGGSFFVGAEVNAAGVLQSGIINISGTVAGGLPGVLFPTNTLLTGNLVDFGFDDGGGDPLQFKFLVTGGDAADLYGGIGAMGGVVATGNDFPGSFASDWSNELLPGVGTAGADTAPVPEPSVLALLSLGALGLAIRRRA